MNQNDGLKNFFDNEFMERGLDRVNSIHSAHRDPGKFILILSSSVSSE